MKTFKKIMFYADGAPGQKAALAQAVELSEHNKANLVVLDVVPEIGTNDTNPDVQAAIKKIQRNIVKARQEVLDSLITVATAGRNSRKVRSRVISGKDAEVIELITREKFELVVKSADKRSPLGVIFGHNDMRLMRKCPCPVWIIKPGRRRKLRKILATVDPLPQANESESLNTSILEIAGFLAERERADLCVLHAWQSPVDRLKGDKAQFKKLVSSVEEDSTRKLKRLLDDFPHFNMSDFVLKGKPEKVIVEFVKSHDIDLLVMGTVARVGIPGFFIGNTAEKVLHAVDCSVLTLKPSGFRAQ